jgi:signal transduction histidine kinase/CheY-like chemotaxis protein
MCGRRAAAGGGQRGRGKPTDVHLRAELAAARQEIAGLKQRVEEQERRLVEVLEQQTATADILRIISSSPTDPQLVFDAVCESIMRLCESEAAAVHVVVAGGLQRAANQRGFTEVEPPRALDPGWAAARAVLERRAVHLHDLQGPEGQDYPVSRAISPAARTLLLVPMLRKGEPVGALGTHRTRMRPFSEQEIRLLETFADQAVVAIENARLFSELQDRNRALTEALAQQTATSDVLRVIASSPTDLQRVLDTIAESAARLCGATDAAIFRLEGSVVHAVARYGPGQGRKRRGAGPRVDARPRNPGYLPIVVLRERRTIHYRDTLAVPEWADAKWTGPDWVAVNGIRSRLGTPLLSEGVAIGSLVVDRAEPRPFGEAETRLLQTFADQAVIAIENARLFQELQEQLERQTATGEVLQTISRSAFDLQAVLDTLSENAVRLCRADFGVIFRREGDEARLASIYPRSAELAPFVAYLRRTPPRVSAAWVAGRAMLEGTTVHVEDVLADPAYGLPEAQRLGGFRTILGVPLLREGRLLGAFSLNRTAVRPFSAQEIALVESYADQAVIAIENTRLFSELQERTQALARSVDELTALGEVTRAVSSTLDVETVLARIVDHARRLSGSEGGALFEYDEAADAFDLRAAQGVDEALVTYLRESRLRMGEGVTGRAAAARAPVQVPDVLEDGAYAGKLRETIVNSGYRSLLAVPLLREERVLGGLVVNRRTPGAFPPEVVALLQTFADQSALAIQNARLFSEIEEKSRQLEGASRHKSEFLAAMSHELRTPLNAVIGFSEVLLERMFGDLNEKQAEYLGDILASGRHLLSLINDILDLSKVEAGRMELELATFSLVEALENGLTMVRERAAHHGIALALEVDPQIGPVAADERKVKQVVFNLLSNAVKFTPDSGRVDVTARLAAGEVRVAVRDSGIGIAPEDQERIFEEFYQAGRGGAGGDAGSRPREGTGLGLALARRFVELQGGRLRVESQPGAGSTFTFTLPMPQQVAVEAPPPEPPETPAVGAPPPLPGPVPEGEGLSAPRSPRGGGAGGEARTAAAPTVLLVDDDPRAIDLLTLYLRGAGFEVVVARDGAEALALARAVQPAVITLDVLLPRLDGWGFLAAAKADPALADIPVVVVSMLDERGKGFALGAAEYLVKPVSRAPLLAALRRLLPPAGPDPRAAATPAGGGAPTVLAIDDDPLAIELLRAVLGAEGYAVLAAAGGEEGLELAQREVPALVILDLLMPEVDGFAAVERLRADPRTATIPIVILTAKTMAAEDRARLEGRISFLAEKGEFSRARFVDLVQRLCPAPGATERAP